MFHLQNTQDPLKNAIVQSQIGGILVSELDWFPIRFADSDIMLLCIAGADGSFRLLEVNMYGLIFLFLLINFFLGYVSAAVTFATVYLCIC